MKLLIVTQKVDLNDDILGFFHDWLSEFAKHCEKLIVICLYLGEYNLPTNVKVLSLGKEQYLNHSRILRRSISLYRFYEYIWRERKNYDKVLVHMNQIYLVLAGIIWRLLGKKIGFWYVHGHIPFNLRIASKLTNLIFTASSESFRLRSSKVIVTGHGININRFKVDFNNRHKDQNSFNLLSIGRISPSKDYETLIKAVEILIKEDYKIKLEIIGSVGLPKQIDYLNKLKALVSQKDLNEFIKFLGGIANRLIINSLTKADLFINLSRTGSIDKAVLEAMACQLLVLTSNRAFTQILADYRENLMFDQGNYQQLAEKIKKIIKLDQQTREKIGKDLREIVVAKHNLNNLIKNIITKLDESTT